MIQKRYTLLYIAAIFSSLLLTSCGAENNMKKGEKALALGEYYDAGMQFQKAYRRTPTTDHELRGKRARKMAQCFDKINQSYKAMSAYANAIRYKQATLDDRLAYARLLLKNGDYKKAEKEFTLLKDSMPDNPLVVNGLLSAEQAPIWKKEGSRYKVKRMAQFNSSRDDYSPMLYGDEFDQLYFTSTRNDAQGDNLSGITGTKNADIFLSEKDDKGH